MMKWERSACPVIIPLSITNFFSIIFFFLMRWKSKNVLEHMSPYLNHFANERWQLCATCSWNIFANLPWDLDKISFTFSFVKSCWNYASANWTIFTWALTWVPLRRFLAFAKLVLHLIPFLWLPPTRWASEVHR